MAINLNMNANVLRFIALLFSTLLISLTSLCYTNNIDLNMLEGTNIKIYYSSNRDFGNEKTYKNGLGVYITPNKEDAKKYILETNFDGIEFTTKLKLENILEILNAKIVKKQKIMINNQEKTIIYACTNKFNKFVDIDNQKVNAQILISSFENKVGLPLLLGSY